MRSRGRFPLAGVVALAALLAWSAPAVGADLPQQAFAESVGLHVDAVTASAGPAAPAVSTCAPGSPSRRTARSGPVGDPAVARVDGLRTSTVTDCVSGTALATSEATKAVVLAAGGPIVIRADGVSTRSMASCASQPEGSTSFDGLTVGGTAVPLAKDVAPNTLLLPEVFGPLGLRVILNEQRPATSGQGLVVNGIHVVAAHTGAVPPGGVLERGDVVISHAVAAVTCAAADPQARADLRLSQTASREVAKAGDTVRLTATIANGSGAPCDVVRVVQHLPGSLELVSTTGPLGTAPAVPSAGGADLVFRPTGLTIAPGDRVIQAITVKVRPNAARGSYSSNAELTCATQGAFISGPLAAVSVLAPEEGGLGSGAVTAGPRGNRLADTGTTPALAATAALLLLLGLGLRRTAQR
jgi:uncharacterized repeat protein (TIGR01451 family)